MSAEQSHPAIRIGEWIAEPALDIITREGQTQKLEPRAMRLLMCMADSAGTVVSIESLLDHVWKDVVVSPASVYQAVSQLRKILGDTDPNPTYITTVPRKGYRLIAPVAAVDRPLANATASPPSAGRATLTASVEKLPKGPADRKPPRSTVVIAGVIIAAAALGLSYWALDKHPTPAGSLAVQRVPSDAQPVASPSTTTGAAFDPPAHSIAVLPFVNISADKEQQYVSDGLTEELLNSLSRINELQVAARTSSFSFQGEHPDITAVAHKLNVAAVLEGSIRRSGNTVRITAQLSNALTGFHLWSQTYDRDLGDVLKVQTEIADAVTSALKVTLLGDVAARIELGGSRNRAAFDAYLRGLKASNMAARRQRHPSGDRGVCRSDSLRPELCARVCGPIARAHRLRRQLRDGTGDTRKL
jgi:transcriptional activator of cad operon